MSIIIGRKLENGATAVATTERQVLAVREHSIHPYAVWTYNEAGQTYWGHYFETLDAAYRYISNSKGENA